MTWYVVHGDLDEDLADMLKENRKAWTVSRVSGVPGWNTDNGCSGYGLLHKDAQFLVDAANEKEAREAGTAE